MIRQPKTSKVESLQQWQTIYCSLMLLLVVFFVMLIAYSSIDKEKFLQLKNISQIVADSSPPAPDMNQAMQSLKQLAITLKMNNDFTVMKTTDGFKAIFPNPVVFGSGDASLNETIYPVLDGIITIAKHNHFSIQVEGHTDDQPIGTAKYPSNWELSTMRAVNILRYLQKNGDIPANRLVAVGFAEYQPAASNDTPEGRRKNRRIIIIFRPEI
jgi:chemotaxis protein MotB